MRILLAAPHWIWSTGRHVDLALRRMGHDVRTVGPCLRNYDGREIDPIYVWEPDYDPCPLETGETGHHLQSTPIEEVLDFFVAREWEPELILSVLGTYSLRGKAPIPHVAWSVETDEYTNGFNIAGANDFDFKFLNDMKSAAWGEPDAHYLASGYDPEVHINKVPYAERPIQLVLVGNPYPERNYFMFTLGRLCRSFYAWGLNWSQFVTAYNAGQGSLCLPSTPSVTPQRVFETLAMGNVLLTRTMPDFERLGLVEDVHYLAIDDVDDAQRHVERIIYAPDSEFDEIHQAAAEWVRPQTWDNRVNEILVRIGMAVDEPAIV